MLIEEINLIPKCPGIYCFRNKINDKYYVGQALNLYKRIRQHMARFRNKRIKNSIYRALEKYGFDNFELKILKTFENISSDNLQKLLDETEIKYIKQFDSYNNGYNLTTGGKGVKNYNYTKVIKKKISEAAKKVSYDGRNKIYFYDIITKEYGEELTLKEFLTKHNISSRNLNILIMKKRYIVARTKEELKRKIDLYNSDDIKTLSKKSTYKEIPEIIINDILNGMNDKDFCLKYKLCRKTYFTYKKRI